MRSHLSLNRRLPRAPYFIASAMLFLTQYPLVFAVYSYAGRDFAAHGIGAIFETGVPPVFWLAPIQCITLGALQGTLGAWPLSVGMATTLLTNSLLMVFAFQRTNHAGGATNRMAWNTVAAVLTIAPVVQIPAILWLSITPPQSQTEASQPLAAGRLTPQTVMESLLVGVGLSLGSVIFSALILRVYGFSLFLISPFVIALTTAFVANRRVDIGSGTTLSLVFGALAAGALALLGVAIEGVVCLVMASPLIAIMGVFGAVLGQAIARRRRGGGRSTLASVAVLPLLMVGEVLLPPKAGFETIESVDIAARPTAVWDAVVHMEPIPDAPAIPFRWGLAYPMRGEIHGTGVGAIRKGVFSTGVAYERVTQWEPEKKLSFIVLSDPPTMHELSPYKHVNAPHVIGYFKTLDARFTITPLVGGKTRLSLATRHELDLEPALYWLPIAEWATHVNKVRVLNHFRQQAEAGSSVRAQR